MDIYKDIKDSYLKNDRFLKAYFSYNNNELLCLDLHESKAGPHGLIGGSTGSGKSELIVSLLLSLCLRYSADYLNIVLIDYKGGGIKESLSYNDVVMPHIIAAVSNLENNVLERLIVALNKECIRRQKLFKQLSQTAHKSIMNIDDYLSNANQALAHLLIVVDEFAELKKESPETIKELVSISRIGRSLGVHLILATQKPGGVIDDEIWSNSHFKIALKVFEEKDSQDLIKCKDAAYLSNVGSFLLQVDASLIKAQSIYSKNDIYDNDPYKVSLLDNNLLEDKIFKKEIKNIVQEASYLTSKIIDVHSELNIQTMNIDFLPSKPMNRLKLVKDPCLAFGEIDDYLNCYKGLLAYNLNDSILVYSSRTKEINSILNTLSQYERQTIVIGNKEYSNTYISDSLTYDKQEDIIYLFNMLIKHPDYNLSLVIQDISSFLSYNENYGEYLYKLIRISESISFIFLTTNSQLGFKIINSFDNKIMINIGDINNLSNFYAMKSKYKGNSFFFKEEPIPFIPIKEEELIIQKPIIEKLIKTIPQSIFPECKNDMYLAGYDLLSREAVFIDENVIITSLDDNYLNIYKKAYPSITAVKYDHSILKKKDVLWLGSGLFSQRLINNINGDIDYNQALLIKDNKKYVLKGLDYAWSFIEN